MSKHTVKVQLSPKTSGLVLAAVGALFLLLGLAVHFFMQDKTKLAKESLAWDEVEATVLVSRADWDVREPRNIPGNRLVHGYRIQYSYRYGGAEHTGNRWSFAEPSGVIPKDEAFARQTAHPVGSKITIRVNPANPDESVVVPGGDPQQSVQDLRFVPFALAGFGALLVFLGALLYFRHSVD